MSTKITETAMSSDVTRHTATAWAVPDKAPLWSVTWLPGRALTRDQAITAMTIAEVIGAHDVIGDPLHAGHRMWIFLGGWAAELGISGPRAVALASMAPEDCEQIGDGQGDAISEMPRTNHDGDPCPSWCTQDHGELLIPSQPVFGYMNSHVSDPMTAVLVPMIVRVGQTSGGTAGVEITRFLTLCLTTEQANMLSGMLMSLQCWENVTQLAEELRAAAQIACDTDGGAE